jgi:hypothetical protein
MVYGAPPPYEILQNKLLDFATLQRLRRFAKYWDLIGNSGNFVAVAPLIWDAARPGARQTQGDEKAPPPETPDPAASLSPFQAFLRLSDWLHARLGRTDSIALSRLMERLFEFLTCERGHDPGRVIDAFREDGRRTGRRETPAFLKESGTADGADVRVRDRSLPKRQARHWAP